MSSPGGSFGSARLHVGTDGSVHCSVYDDALPILTVAAGPASVTLTLTAWAQPGEQGVAFARELAAQAAVFASECERLHAEHQAASESGSGQDAAA